MGDILKCYISGRHTDGNRKQGTISFAVPEFGILFRCMAAGSRDDLEIVAFLSLLKFAEHNADIFKEKELKILTDYSPLVHHLTDRARSATRGASTVREAAQKIARSFRYTVSLIGQDENRAAGSIIDIPAMPSGSTLKIKSFDNLTVIPPALRRSDDMKL